MECVAEIGVREARMQHQEKQGRFTWAQFVDKVFWAVLVAAAVSIARKADRIETSVVELNRSVAELAVQAGNQREDITDLSARVLYLERRNDRARRPANGP
jgi:cell division protein FtsL